MKTYAELTPTDGRKSFYGKAKMYKNEQGDTVLISYTTEVCKITHKGVFVRLWDGYSATTMRHVNAFLDYMGVYGGGKKWWTEQQTKKGGVSI